MASVIRFMHRPMFLFITIIVLIVIAVPTYIFTQHQTSATVQSTTCSSPSTATVVGNSANFKPDVIYQIMVDRFFNGDPSNDNPPGDTGLNDPTHNNWHEYWGGDLAGITQKVPYIAGMGVTAIWLTPIVDNVHTLVQYANGPQAGYHGYWARDDYEIDPHFGTWSDFDTLVQTAHAHNIKIIIDFAANHSNPTTGGDLGNIYKDGVLQASFTNDINNWFHHNGGIGDYNDLYQLEYGQLFDLADFAQENPAVDAYLKGAMIKFLQHGADGFRFDAAKHMPGPTGGWLRTVADTVDAQGPHYMMGEWLVNGVTDPMYPAAVRFANTSGIAELNFPVYNALSNAFSHASGPGEINYVLNQEKKDFQWLNDQAVFIDNHDNPRFLSLDNSKTDLQLGLVGMMTVPGTPIIYYGTEQYLHDDTNGGGDPYNRPMMASFSTTTPAYTLISCLSNLRHTNPALAYGTYTGIKADRNIYVFERDFGKNAVLVAINIGLNTTTLTNLATAMPKGTYRDYLGGKMQGTSLNAGRGGAIASLTLKPHEAAIWQYTAGTQPTPIVGSAGPELARAGETVLINGQNFGVAQGHVAFGSTGATIQLWSNTSIAVDVPILTGGMTQVQVCNTNNQCSNGYAINIASGPQIPVTLTVNALPVLGYTDQVYITGDTPEFGNNQTDPKHAIGPMIGATGATNRFLMISAPAGRTVTYHLEIVHADGSITQENGPPHSITIPTGGTASISVDW